MSTGSEFTATEQRIMDVLADGEIHSREELQECCPGNSYGSNGPKAFQMHLSNIRKKINPKGLDVICQLQLRKSWFRLVRLVSKPD